MNNTLEQARVTSPILTSMAYGFPTILPEIYSQEEKLSKRQQRRTRGKARELGIKFIKRRRFFSISIDENNVMTKKELFSTRPERSCKVISFRERYLYGDQD